MRNLLLVPIMGLAIAFSAPASAKDVDVDLDPPGTGPIQPGSGIAPSVCFAELRECLVGCAWLPVQPRVACAGLCIAAYQFCLILG
jgi:hypothetical protein